jgi:ClpP class serine protease
MIAARRRTLAVRVTTLQAPRVQSCSILRRGLSTVQQEPAEARESEPAHTHGKMKDLLSPPTPPSKMLWYSCTGGGAVLGASGIGILGYTHLSAIMPLLPDLAGVSLMAVGAGLLSHAGGGGLARRRKKRSPGGHEYKVEVVAWNDEARFATAATAIARSSASSQSGGSSHGVGEDPDDADDFPGGSRGTTPLAARLRLGKQAESALAKVEQAAEERAKAERAEAERKALEHLQAELDAGAAPNRLRQKLSPRVFVIDFDTRPPVRSGGGSGAPARSPSTRQLLDDLREQISLLVHLASPHDEVVIRVTSPGGPVADYGLAAAQFGRLKAAGVRTTACVDLVAASGGYMLACAADKVLAAPFSIVGSIGVIAGVPNVHRLLERGGVEFVQRTAGKYKRTLNIFTPNTEEGIAKFDEELALIHEAFVSHVTAHRGERLGGGDPSSVCTGESWLSLHAEPLGLVDGLITSDSYLRSRQRDADVLLLRPARAKQKAGLLAFLQRTAEVAYAAADRLASALPLTGSSSWPHSAAGVEQGAGAARGPIETPFIGAPYGPRGATAPHSHTLPLLRASAAGGAGGVLAADATTFPMK